MSDKRKAFFDLLAASQRPILADGAMGTMLHARGVGFDQCFDELNLSNPALVAEIHRDYIEAGSQIIYTNTFSANPYKLHEHGLFDKLGSINVSGVKLAQEAASVSDRRVFIAGDIGPLGVRLVPYGRVH